jgi:hypothetical protein
MSNGSIEILLACTGDKVILKADASNGDCMEGTQGVPASLRMTWEHGARS